MANGQERPKHVQDSPGDEQYGNTVFDRKLFGERLPSDNERSDDAQKDHVEYSVRHKRDKEMQLHTEYNGRRPSDGTRHLADDVRENAVHPLAVANNVDTLRCPGNAVYGHGMKGPFFGRN